MFMIHLGEASVSPISDGKITDKQREYAREMVLAKRG
jgi:hypothetical protein